MVNVFEKWKPVDYLEHYYLLERLPSDEVHLFRFITRFLKKQNRMFKSVIDIGCGPTIHRAIPFVPYVEDVYLADYVSANLQEIKKWIAEGSTIHNWDDQIRHILNIEGLKTDKDFNERIESFKNKIKKLLTCNIFDTLPIGITKAQFPLVTSFYCIDSITHSKLKWKTAMKNLCGLVEPGGWLIISALRDTKSYKVGKRTFPSANVNEADFYTILGKHGFPKETIDVKIIPSPQWEKDGIKSLLVLSAKKNG